MTQTQKALDEKGFVFIGSDGKPYWCRIYGEVPWFMYWHESQKSWVTLQQVNTAQIMFAYENKLSDKDAQIYHELHDKSLKE